MRDGSGRAPPTRVVALISPHEPRGAATDLRYCFVLLVGTLSLLVATAAFLVIFQGSALSASNVSAARWLLVALGMFAGIQAFLTARLILQRSSQLPLRRLVIEGAQVRLEGPATTVREEPARAGPRSFSDHLLDLSLPFGLTLLANQARDRIVLAVTAAERAVYFGARLAAEDRHAYSELLSGCSTVSDDDAVLDATGPDGSPLEVSVRDLQELANIFLRADRQAFERCFLSDTHGTPVVLDGPVLRIGGNGFDLRAPLEWRATLFQEPFGAPMPLSDVDATLSASAGVMVYQATWVRQGMSEVVFVSLLTSLSSASLSYDVSADAPELASGLLRDMRLMQATPDSPPPAELRIGIERMYMLRLRAALDRAPRPSQMSIPSRATR